jgi:hypothetical protein
MGVPAFEPPFLAQVVQYLALLGYTRKRSQPLSQALPVCDWVAFVRHDTGQRFAKIVLATEISSSAQTKITLMHITWCLDALSHHEMGASRVSSLSPN